MKKGGQMQKSSLVALIMGTASGVLFALGMCMCLVGYAYRLTRHHYADCFDTHD